MKTTPPTPGGVRWRGRAWRVAAPALDAPTDPASQRIEASLREHFPSEVRDLDAARERGVARLQHELKTLTRGDGSPVFTPAEQQERAAAIRQAAAAEFDVVGERVQAVAAEAIEKARTDLAKLDGDDGWSRLTAEQQQKAATRREFLKEDVDLLPPHELARRLRGALAAGDMAELWVLDRYLGMRIDRERVRVDPELTKLHREIAGRVRDPKADDQRKHLEQRVSSAQVLGGRVRRHRGDIDGENEQALANMRQRYQAMF